MTARVLMVQGTASSVGKSLVCAGLCRAFARRGLSVAPYKSQNMSNNAAVVAGGGEIGRAQALQAAAARVEPSVDMNPILLKPESDRRSQVVVLGKPWKSLDAREYWTERPSLWATATAALDRLRAAHDLVVIEGAGSPAEINLRESDLVNMAVARYAEAPVLLVGDIDPGGVFAQFAGTLALLPPEDRALVKGLVINKFRGDPSLLEPGLRMIEGITGVPVLGVLPMLHGLALAEEDAQPLERRGAPVFTSAEGGKRLDIAVIQYPRLANFDDIDALRLEPEVALRFVGSAEELGLPDAVILPGSKATMADLAWLRDRHLDEGLRWLVTAGRAVVGLCGGYQMLGRRLADPLGTEGPATEAEGLGLLPVETVFAADKRVTRCGGRVAGGPGFFNAAKDSRLEGYEIHLGESRLLHGSGEAPFLLEGMDAPGGSATPRPDGAASHAGRVWGSYLHGIFDQPDFRRAWLDSLLPEPQPGRPGHLPGPSLAAAREAALDRLADCLEESLDLDGIAALAGLPFPDTAKEHP